MCEVHALREEAVGSHFGITCITLCANLWLNCVDLLLPSPYPGQLALNTSLHGMSAGLWWVGCGTIMVVAVVSRFSWHAYFRHLSWVGHSTLLPSMTLPTGATFQFMSVYILIVCLHQWPVTNIIYYWKVQCHVLCFWSAQLGRSVGGYIFPAFIMNLFPPIITFS